MKKIIIIPTLTLFLGAGCLVLTGCGNGQQPSEEESTPSEQTGQQPASSPEEESGEEPEEIPAREAEEEEDLSLSSILSRGSEAGSYEYDVTINSPGQQEQAAHVWWSGSNMRVESSLSTQGGTFDAVYLMDMDEEVSHIYMPEQNRAIRTDYSRAKEQVGESPKEKNSDIREHDARITGKETINGKECAVVEYTTDQGNEVKAWIWIEGGFPIRTVTVTDEGEYTMEIDNIDTADIPDSRFELPDGVQVMDMPAGMGF
jgi:outer membrane lipoprotein-sorting protein